MSGWFAMNRAMFQHPIFDGHADRVGVWAWLIATAAWKDTQFCIGSQIITIRRGQLCVSQRQIEKETGVGRQAIRNLLDMLEREKAITQRVTGKATQKRTIITICNYEKYQGLNGGDNPKENPPATHQQPNKEQVNKRDTLEANASNGADAPLTVEVSVTSAAVWNAGKPFLASRGVDNPGAMIGRWLKSHHPLALLSAIDAAQKSGTQDPIPYITEVLKGGHHGPSSDHNHLPGHRADPAIEQIARLAGLGEA